MEMKDDASECRGELVRLDTTVYSAIASTPTPLLDRVLRGVSRAANYSKLWLASSAVLAVAGGPRGRDAAVDGLASVGLTSGGGNGALKPLARRRRPDRDSFNVPAGRQVRMPASRSFPSGHAASAFAFAAGVAADAPQAGLILNVAAAVVAYSRVHTGVHYPGDVIAGSLTGAALAPIAVSALRRLRATRSGSAAQRV